MRTYTDLVPAMDQYRIEVAGATARLLWALLPPPGDRA